MDGCYFGSWIGGLDVDVDVDSLDCDYGSSFWMLDVGCFLFIWLVDIVVMQRWMIALCALVGTIIMTSGQLPTRGSRVYLCIAVKSIPKLD